MSQQSTDNGVRAIQESSPRGVGNPGQMHTASGASTTTRSASVVSVLLVCPSYPPVIGGSEIEAQRVCSELIRRGHHVRVITAGGDPMPNVGDWIDPQGVPVHIHGKRGSRRRRDYVYALGVVRTLIERRQTYDLVYFLMPGIQLAGALPLARLLNKRILMKFSGSNEVQKLQESGLGRTILSFLRRWADRIILLNPGMLEEARTADLTHGLCWLPNPVDTAKFHPVDELQRSRCRTELSIPPCSFVVTYVGRLSPEKNLLTLIEAFAKVRSRFPQALLVLVGDGPARPEIEKRLEELGQRPHVLITSFVDSEMIPKWLQASDVFTLVSTLEGLPVSLIEAMAVGLPSVVSDIPGTTQLVDHEVHGLVAKDVDAIAEAINRLLDDRSLRDKLGQEARERVLERYALDIVAGQYEQLFEEVLAEAPR